MKKRITILVLAGAVSVAAVAAGSLYAVAKSKPQSEAEYRAERLAEFQKKQEEDMERLYKEAMSSDRPEKERRYAGHEYRMFKELKAGKSLESLFHPEDGIDEFEALLLAKDYFSWQFGVCGWVDMPQQESGMWVVRIWDEGSFHCSDPERSGTMAYSRRPCGIRGLFRPPQKVRADPATRANAHRRA